MKIERVDEKTVKCFLSNEELEEYDIDYKDFIMRSEKAREVVQEIIEQAAEEVGYTPPKFAFDLQIMVVADQGLVLTFSDRDPEINEGSQLIECLKEMKRILQKTREATEQMAPADAAPGQAQKSRAKQEIVERPEDAVFIFSSLHNAMEYAAALPGNLRVESTLYEWEGSYYLHMRKGHAAYTRYSRACIQALEFAALYAADEARILQLREHGTCLIAEKAIRKLRAG
ncbi:MAG: adaptor protein MecA [Butyrivibrio sp.]|nr:adaptor protein MecA [Acetatifactor muris]MCM1559308.1 adaptor protein MecA [Butyrivibrio sp.]